jgi:hypothetical protein
VSRTAGATSTVTMTARQLALVSEVGPTGGWVDVTVNGVYQQRVSLWSSTRVPAQVLWVKVFPVEGAMRIDLRTVTSGTRNSVNVDAILVGR